MERIGVVICNYNKVQDVLLCIQSVLENKYTDFHIYVVDNASADASVAEIRSHYGTEEKLTLLVNQENLGGSGGFNTGLRAALKVGHEYLMCVDNDAMLDEDCIGQLLAHLEQNPQTGIAAAKIYHTQEPDLVQQYGSFIDWHNYGVDSTYLNHPEDGSMPDVVYSDAVPACALMIRRSLVEQIGVMPEENFLYWDDTEWCVRCTKAGYRVASVGAAKALHAMGAKKEDVNTFPTYYAWRNWIKFFLDHTPAEQMEDMTQVFLGSVFEIVYSCMYRGEPNKANTVMAAMDDALHGVTGKAASGIIQDLEFSYQGVERVLDGKCGVTILAGDFPLYSENLADQILMSYPKLSVELISKEEETEESENLSRKMNRPDWAVIRMCESIFREEDLSLVTYLMDLDGNVLCDEDDAMRVINYPFSKQSFIFAQKPLFLRLAKKK